MCTVKQIYTLMILLMLSTVKYMSRKYSGVNHDEDDDGDACSVNSNDVTGES